MYNISDFKEKINYMFCEKMKKNMRDGTGKFCWHFQETNGSLSHCTGCPYRENKLIFDEEEFKELYEQILEDHNKNSNITKTIMEPGKQHMIDSVSYAFDSIKKFKFETMQQEIKELKETNRLLKIEDAISKKIIKDLVYLKNKYLEEVCKLEEEQKLIKEN